MSRERVAVVGGGVAGMAAAEELSASYDVTVYDRLPMPGGVLHYDHPAVVRLQERCEEVGVSWMLGTTVVRWESSRLLSAGPEGISWKDFDVLVYAGGSRPATLAELSMTGPRLAGVYQAPVALHLIEAEVVLGHHIVLVGTGWWARSVREALREHHSTVIVVSDGTIGSPGDAGLGAGVSAVQLGLDSEWAAFPGDSMIEGWTPVAVCGTGRVDALVLSRMGQQYKLECDAVVLAGPARPLRNVDGAVTAPAPRVLFVQPSGAHQSFGEVEEQARVLASTIGLILNDAKSPASEVEA